MSIRFIIVLLTIMPLCAALLPAQQRDIPGALVNIRSAILNETRTVRIYAPKSISVSSAAQPVIYVLDGESLFWSVYGAVQFLTKSISLPQMPDAIIVSIHNTHRDRDMPVPQEFTKSEGKHNFLRFLTEELRPFINKRYATNGLAVLLGHSQGGLFATFAAFQHPEVFRFALALDAPMTVDSQVFEEYRNRLFASCSVRYASVESLYGWGKSFPKTDSCSDYLQRKIEGETHESMAHKGIYEGLTMLFRDFLPARGDISLLGLQQHYQHLSQSHQCTYSIPQKVLLASAAQNINQSKKRESLDIMRYYQTVYGKDATFKNIIAQANLIIGAPDYRVDFYLNHSPPTAEQLQAFAGKWKGTVVVPDGINHSIEWEIKKINDRYLMQSRVMDSFTTTSDFLLVSEAGELVWGRKHGGGGIYLSIGKPSADGQTIVGTEDLIGFAFPKGYAPFKQNTFQFQKIR